ncbi:MAG: hypothetical protein A2V66_10680 [Ignavibacteria bacterium RBG_13_36_8]|nr:MAG: hypothetical protein A2V66_10680 [Ignavibacteria bacterium RBG_13_36_8]
MKTLVLIISVVLSVSTYCFGQDEISLRKELDILKSIVGKNWVSEEKEPDGQRMFHFLQKFEPIHNGKTIKRYFQCKELNYQSDGYYYYDPYKKEIAMLELGSNGNFSIGNIKEENGVILKYGYTIFPDIKLKFRNTLEITSEGKLIDKFFSFENGEWKAGHSRIFTAQ